MKLFPIFLFLAFLPSFLFAKISERSVSTKASFHKEVQNDRYRISANLSFENKDSDKAQKELLNSQKKIIAELKAIKVSNLNTNWGVRAEYDYNSGKRTFRNYKAYSSISMVLKQQSQINQVIKVLEDNKVPEIGNAHGFLSDELTDKSKEEVLKFAFLKAQNKAKKMAALSKSKLGKVIFISDSDSVSTPSPRAVHMMARSKMMPTGSEDSIDLGYTKISVEISLQYELK